MRMIQPLSYPAELRNAHELNSACRGAGCIPYLEPNPNNMSDFWPDPKPVAPPAEETRVQELKRQLDAVADALHPHWKGERGHAYVPDQLPGMIRALQADRLLARNSRATMTVIANILREEGVIG